MKLELSINPQTWLSEFLYKRGLKHPDGRMLYEYRTTPEEFNALKQTLGLVSEFGKLSKVASNLLSFPPAFVMFGAEWWQREYRGGAWEWDQIIQAFSADPESWLPQERSACILAGLQYWKQPVREGGKRYFGSVVAQGGIPLVLLAQSRGNITQLLDNALKRAARLGARAEEIEVIVADYQDRLPKSMRQLEIYRLIAQLIEAVLCIKTEFKLSKNEDPIRRLDIDEPNWRDRFPLPLGDAEAKALIHGLIKEATVTDLVSHVAPFSIERYLSKTENGGYQLISQLICPRSLTVAQLCGLLNIQDEELARNFPVDLENTAREPVLDCRRQLGIDPPSYSLSRPGKSWTGNVAAAEHVLHFPLPNKATKLYAPPGSMELANDLPWIFVDLEEALRFCGVGSLRVRAEKAVVVYPLNWSIVFEHPSTVETLGELLDSLGDRVAARVSGDISLQDGKGSVYRIRTSQVGQENDTYVWEGRRLEFASNPRQVFIGIPRLVRYTAAGERFTVASSAIQWRKVGSTQTLLKEHILGPVDAYLVKDGEILLRSRLVVLDANAKLEFASGAIPGEGHIGFSESWGVSQISSNSPGSDTTIQRLPQGWKVGLKAISNTPETINLLLDWPHNTVPLNLRLPYPAAGGRFFTGEGREMHDGDTLRRADLLGSRLRILDSNPNSPRDYFLELSLTISGKRLLSTGKNKLALTGSSTEIRLIDYSKRIELLLGMSDELDARVTLTLWIGNQPGRNIRFMRYDCAMQVQDSGIELSQKDLSRFTVAELGSISVYATPINNFEQPPIEFVALTSEGVPVGQWHPGTLIPTETTLFIYPKQESLLQFRPLILARGSNALTSPEPPIGLKAALGVADADQRKRALATVIQGLAMDFSHPDWKLVESMWTRLSHLPLSALDMWRELSICPEAVVSFSLRPWDSPPNAILDMCKRFTLELGFVWETIPLSAWRHGFDKLRQYWVKLLGEESGNQVTVIDLPHKVTVLQEVAPALSFLLEILCFEVTGIKSENHSNLKTEKKANKEKTAQLLYKELWQGPDSLLQQVLLRQHLQGQWPDGLSNQILDVLLSAEQTKKTIQNQAKSLFWMHSDFKASVANLPALLAFCITTESIPRWWDAPEKRLALKIHRDFDSEWFTAAFEQSTRLCYVLDLLKIAQHR